MTSYTHAVFDLPARLVGVIRYDDIVAPFPVARWQQWLGTSACWSLVESRA